MNNMTEKIIKDGSGTRRAGYNMVSIVVGAVLLLMGLMCIFIKACSVEYIDAAGILHENFFLLPMGFLLMFCGLIVFIGIGMRAIIYKIRKGE